MTLVIGSNFAKPWRAPVAFAQDAARRAKTRERVLAARDAVRPEVSLASSYRRRLLTLIDRMSESVIKDLGRAYGKQDDKIAMISGDGLAYDAAFREEDHPRDQQGKFAKSVYHHTSSENAKAIRSAGRINVGEGVLGRAAYLTENPVSEGSARSGGARLAFEVSNNAKVVDLKGAGSSVDAWLKENGTPDQFKNSDIAGALKHSGVDAIRLIRPSGEVWWLFGDDQSKLKLGEDENGLVLDKPELTYDATFREEDHPRDPQGRFAKAGIGGARLSAGVITAIKAHAALGGQMAGKFHPTDRERAQFHRWLAYGHVDGPVYRTISVSDRDWQKMFDEGWTQPGHIIESHGSAPTSWSRDETRTFGYGGGERAIHFISSGMIGRDITENSIYPEEREIVGAPGIRFEVEDAYYKEAGGYWIIRVIPIPANTTQFWQRELGEDALAYDQAAATDLQDVVRWLRRKWQRRFDDMAQELADYFAQSAARRSDAQLQRILRRGGISVRFKLTPAMKEVLRAVINENVALIKSIPSQYFPQIEGAVMRSVAAGRDLQSLTKELREQHGVTKRRAELIARDQNNKSTAVITRQRYLDLGIERAVWLHSHAGKEPRPTHLANNQKEYDVAKGWFDPDPKVRAYVHPGQLINCRCVNKPVLL